ncbi:MAG: sigma-54 dependent transcriptional regulator [Lacipirellulaceae bacterium]
MIFTDNRPLIGDSPWRVATHQTIAEAAPFRATVLISGPSGTGKELIARALHEQSPRSEGPFVPVNCAAIPHTLFDSQLFGHLKGAFTGADYESLGCFRAAEGGTLFLDEIGELDLDLQAKLLRVLQDREVTPVGSHQPVAIDTRIVAATNRDLEKEVAAGRFRLDLYYRLNVIEIPTLALQERPEDIAPLASHMLNKACVENGLPRRSLSTEAIKALELYEWPGNVRELQNLMERVALASRSSEITSSEIRKLLKPSPTTNETASPTEPTDSKVPDAQWKTLDRVEEEHIKKTLKETFFNQSAAARMLGIDRKRLARKIEKYDLREQIA